MQNQLSLPKNGSFRFVQIPFKYGIIKNTSKTQKPKKNLRLESQFFTNNKCKLLELLLDFLSFRLFCRVTVNLFPASLLHFIETCERHKHGEPQNIPKMVNWSVIKPNLVDSHEQEGDSHVTEREEL